MKNLMALGAAALVSSIVGSACADVFYGKDCSLADATGWFLDSSYTTPSEAAPCAGNTYILRGGAKTKKTGKFTFVEGAILQFGDATTKGVLYTSGSTHTIPTCYVYAGEFGASSDNREIEAGTWTFFSAKSRSSFTFRYNRSVLLSTAMKAISAADVIVDCNAKYPGQNQECSFEIAADMSEWRGSFSMNAPTGDDVGEPVQLRLNSASAMGCDSETYTNAFSLSAGYALCVSSAVQQSDKRGFSVSLAPEEKIFIDTSLYGDFVLSAPIVGGADGTIEKSGAGRVTFDGSVCVTNILVSYGSVAFGSNVRFADGTLVHVCLGASYSGPLPGNVTLIDDNAQKTTETWIGGGADAKMTTDANWKSGKTPEGLSSGLIAVNVEAGSEIAVDTTAVLSGLNLDLPGEMAEFSLLDAGGAVTIGTDGLTLGASSVMRTYRFGAPMTFSGDQVIEVPSSTLIEFSGPISSLASDSLVVTNTEPGAVSLSGDNVGLLGGASFYDCQMTLSGNVVGGNAKSSSFGIYYDADDFWRSDPVVTLSGTGVTVDRPVNITPIARRAVTMYLLHAEEGTTNALGALNTTGIGGSVYQKFVFDENSRTVIDGFLSQNSTKINFAGSGEVELASFLVPSGTASLGPIFINGTSLTAILSGAVNKYRGFTVEAGNVMMLTVDDAIPAAKRNSDASGQVCINGALDIGGCNQTFWEFSGTGVVASASAPATIEVQGRETETLACGMSFGSGVSLNISSGSYALGADSTSEGVLSVSGTGTHSLDSGAQWPNGTLAVLNDAAVELGDGTHRFNRFFIGEQEIPAGIYSASSAPAVVAAVLKGSGRLAIGGAKPGLILLFR